MARYYSASEWKSLTGESFSVNKVYVLGMKSGIVPLPGSRAKNIVLKLIPDVLGQFFTKHLRMGSFLVSELEKKR